MKLKPPLESRRVRTQPSTVTCLPTASAFRACATLIFSMTASQKGHHGIHGTHRKNTEGKEEQERESRQTRLDGDRHEHAGWRSPLSAHTLFAALALLSFFRVFRVFRGDSLLFFSPVLLVRLLRGDFLRHDPAALDLLPLGIDVDAAGALRVVT